MSEKRFESLRRFNRAILNPITRSLVAGRFSFCSLVYHVGRRSGTEYATPVKAVITAGHVFVPLTYGPDTDWYLNVQAAGFCRVKIKGKVYSADNPELVDAAVAAAAFPNNFRARIKLNQFLRLTVKADLQSRMTELADRREWNLEGHEVTCLHIDYRFAFDCWWANNNRLAVIIGVPFELRHLGQNVICEPEDVSSLKEAISILHKPVASLTAFRDGRLLVTFSDGTEIHVDKDPQYESWEAQGEGELEDLALLCTAHEGPPWAE